VEEGEDEVNQGAILRSKTDLRIFFDEYAYDFDDQERK
jgi:hypothetical protein